MNIMLSHVLITGGAGFLGSHLLDRLVKISSKVTVVDDLSSGSIDNIKKYLESGGVDFMESDIKFIEDFYTEGYDIDIIFHYAANPEVRVSTVNPEIHFNENVYATFKILEFCRKHDIPYLVFASSSTVYGDAETIPTPEDHHLNPISVYGASKLAAEDLIKSYSNLYGLRSLIIRYANIIGARSNHGVIIDFINKLNINPNELEILGDGRQRKSYLHVYDAVDATLYLTTLLVNWDRPFEIFNVGSEDWITVNEIADIIVGEMGLKDVKYRFKPATEDGRGWPGDVKFMLLNISKLKSTGWKPRWNSHQAVRKTVRQLLNKE